MRIPNNNRIYKKYDIIGFLTTSNIEIIDILKAWIAVSIAFSIVLGGISKNFPKYFLISAIAVGLGFLLHELSHKLVAQYYKFKAEFRSFDEMLFLAVIMSFLGFVIAAPGAVMIQTQSADNRKSGLISVAGPSMNILLAVLFLGLFYISSGFINELANYGFRINAWLALFNMIPFWLFDGAKIFRWNKIIWVLVVFIAGFFVFGINTKALF